MAGRIPKIVVIGGCYVDMTVQCEQPPQSGKLVNGSGFSCRASGSGPNQAIEAVFCDCQASVIASIGEDSFGGMIKDNLVRFGVNADNIFATEAKNTGISVTMVDDIGDNIGCISVGANNALTADHIASAEIEQVISDADCCLLDSRLNTDAIITAIRCSQIHKTKIVLDIGSCTRQACERLDSLPMEFFSVNVLVAEPDKAALSDNPAGSVHDAKLVAADIITRGVEAVVMRAGRKGCFIVDRNGTGHIKPFYSDSLLKTSGRDAFLGALAASIAVGDSIKNAVKFAMAAEVLACRKMLTQDNLPKKTEILELLQRVD